MIAFTGTNAVQLVLAIWILCIFYLVREVKQAGPPADRPCPYCRDTGYVRFEVWKNAEKQGDWPTLEQHERPCSCTAGIGKERRRVA